MQTDGSKITPHMAIVSLDGKAIGTVDRVEGSKIKLTCSGTDTKHHYVDLNEVLTVQDDKLRLNKNADVLKLSDSPV